jgi:hypothetical protein
MLQLFTLIHVDPEAYHPKLEGPDLRSSFDSISPNEPRFPKSLYLIQPLFSAYELNPVAQATQGHVAIPGGLDLDAWIVPSESAPADKLAAEPEKPRVRKNKKSKEKESAPDIYSLRRRARCQIVRQPSHCYAANPWPYPPQPITLSFTSVFYPSLWDCR